MKTKIPSHAASISKMSKKGWKCWAMRVNSVAKQGMMPFEGDRLEPGCDAELTAGDVVLFADDSSKSFLYVAIEGPEGIARLPDMAVGGNATSLAPEARRLLSISPAQRITEAAKAWLKEAFSTPDENDEERASRAHFEKMAADFGFVDSVREMDLSAITTSALIAELQRRGALPANA